MCSCMQLRGLYEVLTNTAASLTEFAREAVPKFQVATITGYSLLRIQQASHPRLVALQLLYSVRLSGYSWHSIKPCVHPQVVNAALGCAPALLLLVCSQFQEVQ